MAFNLIHAPSLYGLLVVGSDWLKLIQSQWDMDEGDAPHKRGTHFRTKEPIESGSVRLSHVRGWSHHDPNAVHSNHKPQLTRKIRTFAKWQSKEDKWVENRYLLALYQPGALSLVLVVDWSICEGSRRLRQPEHKDIQSSASTNSTLSGCRCYLLLWPGLWSSRDMSYLELHISSSGFVYVQIYMCRVVIIFHKGADRDVKVLFTKRLTTKL